MKREKKQMVYIMALILLITGAVTNIIIGRLETDPYMKYFMRIIITSVVIGAVKIILTL
jgi:hypothetical protein